MSTGVQTEHVEESVESVQKNDEGSEGSTGLPTDDVEMRITGAQKIDV